MMIGVENVGSLIRMDITDLYSFISGPILYDEMS